MNQISDYKTLEYLNLDIKNPENYTKGRKTTGENNRLVCLFKENYFHKIHSNSNNNNYEQLNTIVDLLCNLSENIKLKLETYFHPPGLGKNTNLGYLKDLLEDIFRNSKEETKNQTAILKNIEKELEKTNNFLETILYGKQQRS